MNERRQYNRGGTQETEQNDLPSSRNISGNGVYNVFEIELPKLGKSKKPPEDEVNRANTLPAFVSNTDSSIIDDDHLPTEVGQGIGFRNKGILPPKEKKKETKQFILQKHVDLAGVLDDPDFVPELTYKEPLMTRLRKFLKSSDKSATFKCFFFMAYILVGFGVLISFMLFHFGAKELSLQSLAGAIDYLYMNINAQPLHNLTVTSSTNCPKGLDPYVIGTTTGTIKGCSCTDINAVLKGTCNGDSTCTQYEETPGEDILYWKNVSFCSSYFSMIKEVDCKSAGYSTCYPGFCFDGAVCPSITQIKKYDFQYNNFSLKLGTNTYINLNQSVDEPPIFSIGVSLYGRPCFDAYSLPYSTVYYPLVPNAPLGCGRYGEDNNSFIIDNSTQLSIYAANNLSNPYTNFSGYLGTMELTPMYLIGRKKIAINATLECLNNQYTQFVDISYYLFKFNEVTSFWLLLGLCLHTTLLFGSWIMYYYMRSELTPASQIFQKRTFQIFYLSLVILEDTNFVLMLFRMFYYRTQLIDAEGFFEDLLAEYCFPQPQIVLVLSDYADLLNSTVDELLLYCLILDISLGACSVFLFLGLLGGKSRQRRGRFVSRFK
jgi:hypothetical protein